MSPQVEATLAGVIEETKALLISDDPGVDLIGG